MRECGSLQILAATIIGQLTMHRVSLSKRVELQALRGGKYACFRIYQEPWKMPDLYHCI